MQGRRFPLRLVCCQRHTSLVVVMRDKEAINGMVAEIAGDAVAKEHITSTAKTQKAVIKSYLDGNRSALVCLARCSAIRSCGLPAT